MLKHYFSIKYYCFIKTYDITFTYKIGHIKKKRTYQLNLYIEIYSCLGQFQIYSNFKKKKKTNATSRFKFKI